MRNLLTILLVVFPFTIFAQSLVIRGAAPTYGGEKATLYTYHDFLSWELTTLDEASVGDDGAFRFEANIDQTSMCVIRIGHVNAQLFAAPGSNYQVTFPPLGEKQAYTIANTNIVELGFDSIDLANDINACISDFNVCYEQFFADNYEDIASRQFGELFENFKTDVEGTFSSVKDEADFFANYRQYAYAGIEQLTHNVADYQRSKRELFERHIKDKPVLYQNPEYFNFLDGFYGKYLIDYMFKRGEKIVLYAVNERASYSLLMKALERDDFLEDKRLRELILIRSLGDLYHHERFIRGNVAAILDSAATLCEFEENRQIAEVYHKRLTQLLVGQPAPDFTLQKADGESFTLSSLKGKYVYLDFWATWNNACLLDKKLMPEMLEKYGKDVVFVSISLDEDTAAHRRFVAAHPEYDWAFLHVGDNQDILNDYAIRALPSYFLIDPAGKFIQSPAYRPSPNGVSKGIDETLHYIHVKLHPVQGSGVGERNNTSPDGR